MHNKGLACLTTTTNCAAGWTRGTTAISSQCKPGSRLCPRGTAQTLSAVGCNCGQKCAGKWPNKECWIDCDFRVITWECIGPTPTITPTSAPTSTPAITSTPIPSPSPTPTVSQVPWVKIKDSSYSSLHNLSSMIPLVPVAYDSDDDGSSNLIVGSAGVVTAPTISITTLNPNAKTSNPEYKSLYTPTTTPYSMTPAVFLSYVQARKEYKVITDIYLSEIDKSGIYVYNGDGGLQLYPSSTQAYNVVIICTSPTAWVQVYHGAPATTFAPTGSVAVVARHIIFSGMITQANGIFIGDIIDTGARNNAGLKIVGNLVAQNTFTNGRTWDNPSIPSVFVVFDSQKYLNLLPYLSMADYQWEGRQ